MKVSCVNHVALLGGGGNVDLTFDAYPISVQEKGARRRFNFGPI